MSTLRAAYFKNVKMKQAALYFSPFVHKKRWPWMWCKDPDEEQEVRLTSKPAVDMKGQEGEVQAWSNGKPYHAGSCRLCLGFYLKGNEKPLEDFDKPQEA